MKTFLTLYFPFVQPAPGSPAGLPSSIDFVAGNFDDKSFERRRGRQADSAVWKATRLDPKIGGGFW
jgi:hypothetical protein